MRFEKFNKSELLNFLKDSETFNELTLKMGYVGSVNPRVNEKIKEYYKKLNINITDILHKNKIASCKKEENKARECKFCHKIFHKKYSKSCSGNFCSKKCAIKYSSTINKTSTKEKLLIYSLKRLKILKQKYYINPKKCKICGKTIDYEHKKNKTCSLECSRKLATINNPHKNDGGYREGSSRGYHRYYKGIWCDSTYELAYLIYCLDHNINIKRCQESFEYEFNGVKHKYHPDFIVNGVIVEIKNYYREENDIKLDAISKEKKILYYEDLIPCFEYVSKAYGKVYKKRKNNFYELYD